MMGELLFSGGVFSDAIDGGRAGAEIELLPMGILARTPDGKRFEVPYRECQLEIGGFSGWMVFCRNRDRSLTIFCEDRKFPSALSSASAGILDEQLNDKLKKQKSESRRGSLIAAAVLVAIVLLVVGGYFGVRAGARAAVRAVPTSVDREIGAMAFESMELGGPELDDPAVAEALQSMIDRLAPHAALNGMEFEVHVVDSPMVNAFALPGGKIVVYTGLVAQAAEPEQVAGVLAHEMAHVTLRHGLHRIGQALGLAAAVNLLLGDTGGLVAKGSDLFQLASINSYSRDQENAADAEGARMLHAAGMDPMALTRFLEALKEEKGDLPGVVSWMGTHPRHEERIEAIRRQAAEWPKQEFAKIDVDWADIQELAK
ncbi:MAG: M48 family metallopeptidase [Planctomycetaceae bacterium]|nr:M48 family metallopeptidase [Planctomycetaceae bacterium]